jgi:tetratricopeptide (TPR) repeat protein
MVRLDRVVFIGCFAALVSAAAPASADGVGRLANAMRAVTPPVARSPIIFVSDSEPRDGEDSSRPLTGGASSAARPEPPPPAEMRRQKLDDLFARLAASTDFAETNGLVLAIDRLQLDSGSNTSDFLMGRAIAAIETRSLETSLALLDKIIILQPGWAEAWNKRATVRYLAGDDQGSMADIAHVLILEPRHFGALSGMGMILERRGFRDEALRAYRRALEIAPQLPSLRAAVERLTAAVNGQGL